MEAYVLVRRCVCVRVCLCGCVCCAYINRKRKELKISPTCISWLLFLIWICHRVLPIMSFNLNSSIFTANSRQSEKEIFLKRDKRSESVIVTSCN